MKKIQLFLLFSLLFAACVDKDEDEKEQPIFVTNITMPAEETVFSPGEKVTIKAQGFQADDEIMLEIRWPLTGQPLFDEGSARGVTGVVTEKTATNITFLAPGHYPASTTEVLLSRSGERMSLGKIKVKNGEASKDFQLYGIINSHSGINKTHASIDCINLTTGDSKEVTQLEEGEDFICAVNVPGVQTICGIKTGGDNNSAIGYYDLSMHYWTGYGNSIPIITMGTTTNNGLIIVSRAEAEDCVYLKTASPTSRSYLPSMPSIKLPNDLKVKALSPHPCVMDNGSYLLLSADNGNGTFSPIILDSKQLKAYAGKPVEATALIPFWKVEPVKDTGTTKYIPVGGYAVVKANGPEKTELRLWNSTTMTLEEPFTTFANGARSITSHIASMDTQELYMLVDTNRGDGLIFVYDLLKNKWRSFPGINYPYSEIVLAR